MAVKAGAFNHTTAPPSVCVHVYSSVVYCLFRIVVGCDYVELS